MIRIAIVTVSDSRSQGTAIDQTTIALRTQLVENHYEVCEERLVSDDKEHIIDALISLSAQADLIFTARGTGLGARDITPEATLAVIDREVPGLAELMRAESAKITRFAWLSRARAGIRGDCLIVNLPGSPKAAVECAQFTLPLVEHAIATLRGAGHDPLPANTKANI